MHYVSGIIVHPDYDPVYVTNDIAMVITSQDIEYNSRVAAIALPEEADLATLYAEGAPITVIGR